MVWMITTRRLDMLSPAFYGPRWIQRRSTASLQQAQTLTQAGLQARRLTLVTKSGTNRFHGSAYEYYLNRYFAAND